MLNECLIKEQSQGVEITNCDVRVGDTGMPAKDSVNLGPKRLAKLRFQRMRRRQNRGIGTSNVRLGWATRMI